MEASVKSLPVTHLASMMINSLLRSCLFLSIVLWTQLASLADERQYESAALDSSKVALVFKNYCTACHGDNDPDADLSLTSLQKILQARSTDDQPLVQAGQPDESLLFKLMTGKAQPKMPPEEEPQPSAEDIELIRKWISEGARDMDHKRPSVATNSISPAARESSLVASAVQIDAERIAFGRTGQVDIVALASKQKIEAIEGILGKVTSLRTSVDGKLLVVGSGSVGTQGQITIVELPSLKIVRQLSGHNDLVYCAAISSDGQWLASGSYDRKVILWKMDSAEPTMVLSGHNGPIYDLDFHPNGQMLATASGDQTIKLWKIPDGSRLDTLGQPEGEMRAVRFSGDGKLLYGSGADRQIRQWLVDPSASTGSPMLIARFAHEREVLRMAVDDHKVITASADGTVKLWTVPDLLPMGEVAGTKAIPIAVCMSGSADPIVVDLKGNLQTISSGKLDQLLSSARNSSTATSKEVPVSKTDSATRHALSGVPKELIKLAEAEPNSSVDQAAPIELPIEISGSIHVAEGAADTEDSDLFKFTARSGDAWLIEVIAASEKSPLDSFIDILDSQGQPVLQTRLQALRESYFTFRGKDSSTSDDFRMHKWQDMELDEYLYSGGEVTRLWLYPRGPDSGFKVYPGAEARHTFFGTTPISHPLGDPAYIVRPLGETEQPLPNGLPVFPIYFENDDDPLRERGSDSRLVFRAPLDGQYILRIRDARGFSGPNFGYRAIIRPLKPDYSLSFGKLDLAVPVDSGLEWSVKAKRYDGMESAIEITLHGLPEGILATNPVVIEANQLMAFGTVYVGPQVKPTAQPIEISLTAKTVPADGSPPIEKELTERIKLTISETKVPKIVLLPQTSNASDAKLADATAVAESELNELTIRPGQTISARLRVERNGVEGGIGFGKEDSGRNLPHGSFVDNIGLNGLLIVEGQNEREFFITAAPKVSPGRYQFHFRSETKGNPTSKPLWLNVVK